ncbi:hypothetical protein C8F04DRAFT_1141328 [Mycena alexandri]|uniref:Uncharacterized protein n=1 Tax=Mycena alexandri TaxID=1745969 RepID=A0AAD6S643_9AGAR|nr:hypothetical protein C8F04DRAFT_1147237 [Mycena alexandri]KAJ7021287.1 hypothetical protein C8F04DRAFT_1141328 [Mycena alexandri]
MFHNVYVVPLTRTDTPFTFELPVAVEHAVLEFKDTDAHYDLFDDRSWASLVPAHQGRVKLGSPPQEFDVGLFSDLACLDTARRALTKMRDGSRETSAEAERCFGQVRQAIECMADVALEPTVIGCDAGGACGPGASGDKVDHRCRNWEQVRNFVEENQAAWGTV